jgi:aminoglycoside 3-N-acetyltransferase
MEQSTVPFVTRQQIETGLTELGVQAGQTVMLHASVKTVGWLLGGPIMVLEALLNVVTPSGTVMMLASWEGNPYPMAQWPEEHQQACLVQCPPFDPVTSPADHREMSILAEYLRTWPNAHRSHHPLASFVAVGQHATWLTEIHPLHYGMGPDSPLARLCEIKGHVLLLGAPCSNITLLHHAEHLARIPDKRIDRYKMPIVRDGQRVWIDIEEFDTTNGIADFGTSDYFLAIGQAYLAAGKGRSVQIGNAPSFLFDADDIKQFGITWMEQNHQPAIS